MRRIVPIQTLTMLFKKKKALTKQLTEQFGHPKPEDFNYALIDKYFRKKKHHNALQVISETTCNDLDFEELFCFLDRTQTPIGQIPLQ